MPVSALRIAHFRNLTAIDLTPTPAGLNIIYGPNGSGKTSLLEALHFLSLGRSFRTSTASRLIQHDHPSFSLFSQVINASQPSVALGISRDLRGHLQMRIDEKPVNSMATLAALLPTRIIHSQTHQLCEAGPVFRRKFLDWGLFYQSPLFLNCWQQYERVLKQRNAILREQRPKAELMVWTEELVKWGLLFDKLRRDYLAVFTPLVTEAVQTLLNIDSLVFTYAPGWEDETELSAILAASYREEYGAGCTQFGPHRADLVITQKGVPVKHFLSRGQQKLLICAMILAQGKLLSQQENKALIYLVDDLPAELDIASRQKLISLLSEQQAQIFITAIESKTMGDFIKMNPRVEHKVFHVEHGQVNEVAFAEDSQKILGAIL